MVYYLLVMVARLIPGEARRRRFIEWARLRFSTRAIVEAALAEHRMSLEKTIYRGQMAEPPMTMTVDETLDALIDGQSIARFGDGELMTMKGRFDEFQTPGAELSRRLREVLASDEPGLLVGIPIFTYELSPEIADGMQHYCLSTAPWLRSTLKPFLIPDKVYAATEVSLAHSVFRPAFDRRAYFDKFRRVWEGADVVLVHGEGIFDRLSHDIFDNAASIDHIIAPRQDAFEQYDDILHRVLQAPKGSLILLVLGPTATVLAFDLHRAGYRALDLGHIAKSYDWWLNDRTTYDEAANIEFFAPD